MKKLFIATLIGLTGCATTSPVLQPEIAAPQAWSEAPAQPATPINANWWTAFDSPELHALIQQALAGSPDLAIAAERVRQAEARVRVAGASLFPSVDVSASSSARRTRNENAGSATTKASGTTLSASYELDLWGGSAANVRGAQAGLRATAFDRDAAQLTLVSGVASAYFDVLALRKRMAVARENLALSERVLALVNTRAREGAVSPLDVARQEAAVLSQRAAVVALEQQERQVLAALAVLTGQLPENFAVMGQNLGELAVPVISPGLPADLLVRRPDLAAAEAQLVAANADLAAARAALLPSIQLTGSAGVASGALLNFLGGPTTTAALAASVLQPIFDGGRLRAGVALAESRERELVESYRAAILSAFADVETALAAAIRLQQREALQEQVEARAREALRLAEVRYREGADDLLSVLDAQRTLSDAQQQLALVRQERLDAAVSLYKALGGGWQPPASLAAW